MAGALFFAIPRSRGAGDTNDWCIVKLLSVTSGSMRTKLFKFAQEKVWLGEMIVPTLPWLLPKTKQQTKPKS